MRSLRTHGHPVSTTAWPATIVNEIHGPFMTPTSIRSKILANMKLDNLTVVLPCHSLEDLSLDRSSVETEQILSAWSAFYHPALIVRFRGPPGWRGAINAPSSPEGHLLVVPPCSEDDLPCEWLSNVQNAEAVLIRGCEHRDEVLAKALEVVDDPAPEGSEPDLIDDFLALGYCHLLVELLTRQLRYMSNLDEVAFESSTLSAAEKWAEGDTEAAQEHLRSAFDLLTEAREYFYPVETHLLDFTLVAPTTIGPALQKAIAQKAPTNLVLSGATLEAIAEQNPNTLGEIRKAFEAGELSIVGGEWEELELPLLGPEATLAQFRRGRVTYERLLGSAPKIYCRRRFGLSPLLPQILDKHGFTGACHFTLDDGRFPTGNQSRIKWEGTSRASIDSLVRLPCDASRAGTFLALAEKLGNAMDLDHAATAVFAHWPGEHSIWYDALVRACSYSPVLGRFFSIDEYFKDTKYVGQATRYPVDGYRSPFLRQAVDRGDEKPLSQWQEAANSEIAEQVSRSLQTMAAMIAGSQQGDSHKQTDDMQAIRDCLATGSIQTGPGCLVVNPLPFTRKIPVDVSPWEQLPAVGGSIVAAAEQDKRKTAVVSVPGMGFAWIDPHMPPSEATSKPKKRQRWFRAKNEPATPPMAEENILRNDFFEVKVDPVTGAMRSLHDYHTRDNRLAMQLACRHAPQRSRAADDEEDTLYTVMAADEVAVRTSGPLFGELMSRGRLLDRDGTCVARYEQILRARRGSRVLEIELSLDPECLPAGDPWNNYYAARFAWSDATTDFFTGLGTATLPCDSRQLETSQFIDLRCEKINTTILTGGLPYHRRFGLRKMDSLLIVPGETQRRFRLGVGVDVAYPFAAASEFLAPESILTDVGPAPAVRSGWLFHLNAKNVVATAWEPIYDGKQLRGVRARLAETENRDVNLTLQCFCQVAQARKVDFLGEQAEDLNVDGDRVTVPTKGHEWMQIEIDFQ